MRVQPDEVFGRAGRDLTVRLPITFAEAALGGSVRVPTLADPVTVKVPPGTPAGKVLRVRGRGIPAEGKKTAGDLLVTIDVQIPTELSDAQRAAVATPARDLDALDELAGLFDRFTTRSHVDAQRLLQEFRKTLLAELDYREEARKNSR